LGYKITDNYLDDVGPPVPGLLAAEPVAKALRGGVQAPQFFRASLKQQQTLKLKVKKQSYLTKQ
jgi:hypothetical protein